MSPTGGHAGPEIVLIAAVARNGAIGRDNGLLWSDPADMRHFRELTRGHPVVMGRRTWESLPPRFRPLPGRRNVVLSRDAAWRGDGAEPAVDLPSALQMLAHAPTVFVIGGAQVYAQAMALATRLELTEVEAEFDAADAHFPTWAANEWIETGRQALTAADGVGFAFVSRVRCSRSPAACDTQAGFGALSR